MLLNTLMTRDWKEPEQLVIIIAIRKSISGFDEPPAEEILETNILHTLSQLLMFADTSVEIRIMKVSLAGLI